MKKIITGIVIIGIILGLGLGGYWLYRKFVNPDVVSELEKIEINPDERNGITDNLITKDEKLDMVIQLIDDINNHKISYNFKGEYGDITYYVKDKYEIYFTTKTLVKDKDYMDRVYVSGTIDSYTMYTTNSKTIHEWRKLSKESIHKLKEEIEVDLAYEEEVLYGKHDMGYNANSNNSSYKNNFTKLVDLLKTNRSDLSFSENNGIFNISYGSNRIETDGIKYINIDGYSIVSYHLELNNKELYEKMIAPIKGIKNFPVLTNTEEQPAEQSLRLQSKYDHKKLMSDYIASIEPKNQTWNVEKVEDVDASVGVNTSYLDKTGENDLMFLLSIDFTGKLELSNSMSSSRCKYFGIKQGFEIKSTETSKTYQLDIDSINSILIFNSISNPPYIESGTGELNDFTLHILFVVNDDKSCSLKLSGNFSIKDVNGLMDLSFEYNETIDSYKRWGNYIEGINAKWESKILLNSYSDTDKNGNKYILNKQQIIDDKSEDNLLDDGTTYSRIIGDLLKVVLN